MLTCVPRASVRSAVAGVRAPVPAAGEVAARTYRASPDKAAGSLRPPHQFVAMDQTRYGASTGSKTIHVSRRSKLRSII